MFYNKIIISGCERFSISGRYYIEIVPTAKVQMILGTNGSGKTSLATLGFSPLPIDAKWMMPGGYWIKEGQFKGDKYRLEGHYNGKPTFTFIKNDEVLLQDGSVSNYLSLVKTHLEYSKWLHELWVGRVKFTELGPQQRQDLLSNIAKSDFSHAFKLLTKFKKLHQHHLSVNKFLQQRINEESSRLIDETTYNELMQRKEQLMLEYNELQSIEVGPQEPHCDLNKVYNLLLTDMDGLLTSPQPTPLAGSESALQDVIERLKNEEASVRGQVQLIEKEIEQYQQSLGVINTDVEGLEEKRTELDRLTTEIAQFNNLPDNIPVEYLVDHPTEPIQALMSVLGTLPHEKPDNDLQIALERSVMVSETTLRKFEAAVERIESELALYSSIEQVTCPACKHSFQPGVDPEVVVTLSKRKDAGLDHVTKTSLELTKKKDELVDYLERKSQYDLLHDIQTQYQPHFPGLFRYIDSLGGLAKGKMLLSTLNNYQRACQQHHAKTKLQARIERLKAVTEQIEHIDAKKKELTDILSNKGGVLYSLKERAKVLKLETVRHTDNLHSMYDEGKCVAKLSAMMQDFDKELTHSLNRIQASVRRRHVQHTLSAIANIDNTLTDQTTIRSLISDFEQQLANSKLKAKVAGEIVATLSPKTGLLAEQIAISIGSVINGLNQLFEKIWGYPLRIEMGSVGDNGLDYKFPMKDSSATPRDDVSEGSDSMLEMVNRAIVIMSYYSLDVFDYPIFLDEPGRTFDKTHKLNLIPFIRDLSDDVRFSQIVLISHSEDVQTAFPNSETIILDDRNIDYPHPYNLHVSFDQPQTP